METATKKTQDLLPMVRIWLRKSTTDFDDEIIQTMEAGLEELSRAGVVDPSSRLGESSIQQAVKLYCKANFGYGDPDGKFQRGFDRLRDSLAIADTGEEVRHG